MKIQNISVVLALLIFCQALSLQSVDPYADSLGIVPFLVEIRQSTNGPENPNPFLVWVGGTRTKRPQLDKESTFCEKLLRNTSRGQFFTKEEERRG